MIATSKAPVRVVSPFHAEGEAERAYLIRPGDVNERGMFEASLAADFGASEVWPHVKLATIADGLAALLPKEPDTVANLVAIATADMQGEEVPAADRQALAEVLDVLRQHWPDYRQLVLQETRRKELAPTAAFRWFVVGVEGVKVELKRGLDGLITLETMAALNPLDIAFAGGRAIALLWGRGAEKNSAPPSKSGGGRRTSPAGGASRAAGRSAKTGGRKTPSSRSRPGSGQS
jgi:hypothetical protein